MNLRYLALDLGSTYVKCARIENGAWLDFREAQTPTNDAPAPRYEIDAERYAAVARALLDTMPEADAIPLSTQMHGYVLTDARFRPVSPYVSWQDRAFGDEDRISFGRIVPQEVMRPGGVPVKPNLALCALFARMRAGLRLPEGALLCSLGGYMIGRLTGEHVCHITNAAPMGMVDVRAHAWNGELIRRAGLQGLRLPRILSGVAPAGYAKHKGRRIPVYPDMGDQQVCAYGAGLEARGTLHVNVGTAGLIGCLSDVWRDGQYENRPWIREGTLLRTVSGLTGGRDVDAFRCAHRLDWAQMETDERALRFYAELGEQYAQAAARMADPGCGFTRVVFSGGSAAKSAILRSSVCSALRVPPGEIHGIEDGFIKLAKEIDNGR